MPDQSLEQDINDTILRNFEDIQRKIELRHNPNPVYVLCLLLGYYVAMYCLYIFLIKDDISGIWKNSDERIYKIIQNKFTDNVIIYEMNKKECKKTIGTLHGNLLITQTTNSNNIGMYLNDRIKWLDDKIWYKTSN